MTRFVFGTLSVSLLALGACDDDIARLPLEEEDAAVEADALVDGGTDAVPEPDTADAGPDGGGEVDAAPPVVELPIVPSQGFLDRQAEYLQRCVDGNGPGQGGIYGQACRVMAGEETFNDGAIDAAIAKLDAREDTADFRLAGLVRFLYLDDDTGALGDARRAEIERALLDFKYWIDEPGEDQMSYWTENHQILYHSGELLVGQRFPDTEFTNSGMTGAEHVAHALPRLERWLDLRGRIGFSEWHSNVYFNEDIPALVNLVDFAADETIRVKAQMVLDLIALDLLNNTYKGWFATTHGRTYPSKWLGGMSDSTGDAAWIMLGLGERREVSNFSASFLATSEGYTPAPILEDLAEAVRERHEHKQRDSLDVAAGPDFGIGYDGLDDVVVWAGLQAIAHPLTIAGSMDVMEEYDLWDGFLFGSLPEDLLGLIRGMDGPDRVALAEQLEPLSVGLALESVDTYVYRTPHYQLAAAQDWKPGHWNAQTLMWQATLDREALVLTVAPGGIDAVGESDLAVNDPWNGGWLPRVTAHQGVAVIQYHREPLDSSLFEDMVSAELNHAYFPRGAFDEVVEDGHWVLGRKGDGYIALWSQEEASWVEENDYELLVDGTDNTWIVQMGSVEEFEDFDAFVEAVTGAEITTGEALRYESPSVGAVEVGWTGPMTVDGEAVDIGPYERWDNARHHTEYPSWVTRVTLDGETLELDFEEGRRRLLEAPSGE